MRDNYLDIHIKDGHSMVTWTLMYHVKLEERDSNKLSKFRVLAWQSLSKKEKEMVIHPWKKADVQQMENEKGPVDTVAVMFETKQDGQDGFIVVYIDQKTLKITGTETFY